MKLNIIASLIVAAAVVLLPADAMVSDKKITASDAKNWPSDGSWIVELEYEANERFQTDLDEMTRTNAKYQSANRKNKVKVTKKIESKTGWNAVVVEGVDKADLKKMKGFKTMYANLVRTKQAYAWGIDRQDQTNLPLDRASYSPAFCGAGVDIYVLDTGIDTTHTEFSGSSRTVQNIWNSYGSVTADTDGDGHGTHCAGSVGGNTIGIATCANIYGMKILSDQGSGTTDNILLAMNEVIRRHLQDPSRKSVVSMSLGGGCDGACSNDPLVLKVEEMRNYGIISALASGNSYTDAANGSPAAAVNGITVSATQSNDIMSDFSNYGSIVDIQSPGSTINSACATRACNGANQYIEYSGTSMATPQVAGILAQNVQKGNIQMTSSSAVDQVRASMLCDAVPNKITLSSSASGSPTTRSLSQVPTNDGKWACQTVGPPGPTAAPLESPTNAPVVLPPIPAMFPAFTASNTTDATRNTVNHDVEICGGQTVTFSLCTGEGASCSQDPFLRLLDSTGYQVAENDDTCGLCSSITYTASGGCTKITLVQGCYATTSCGGQTATSVTGGGGGNEPVALPTTAPIANPTQTPIANPTQAPIANPTREPTDAPVSPPTPGEGIPVKLPAFTASNTADATRNTVNYDVEICGGQTVTFSLCTGEGASCSQDPFLRLLDSTGYQVAENDDTCGLCSSITYTASGGCTKITLVQGCYATTSCGGQTATSVSEGGNTDLPAFFDYYSASGTRNARRDTVDEEFEVCDSSTYSFSTCPTDGGECDQDPFFRLYEKEDDNNLVQIRTNDDSCGLCPRITYQFNNAGVCKSYLLRQGCYGVSSCGGKAAVVQG